ncbi:MAG: cytochrome c oxidase subunit 3 [Hyphomicrobiales bacterium]|nr:cytochrome c oxidase subunit 3 [Hyphomicrobiales bacterium]
MTAARVAPVESSALREPWKDIVRQRQAVELGMWAFLASELLFFSGLFAGYTIYRSLYPQAFWEAGAETDLWYGGINTAILLVSSAVMAVVPRAARWPELGLFARTMLWLAALLGMAFLVLKGFEYREDFRQHLWPGPDFKLRIEGAELFFAFYWILTSIHAVHLIIGIALVTRLAIAGARDPEWFAETPAVRATALYWGLVDIIWTVVFVVIYLPGRGG